ncbi:MAG TPA: HAMP domain-containing sensor histidine kinase [Usitatibacter sp.]|nr:HAMP domain-containing sensor histidine kinase [Usitatibacter sp.]
MPARKAAITTGVGKPAKPATPGTMNFMRRFGALSFLTVACAALATAMMLSHFLAKEMLQWDASVTAEFVSTVAEIQSNYGGYARRTGVAELLGKTASAEELGVSERVVQASTSEFFDHMRALPGAVTIKVYARDRTVVWSHRSPNVAYPPEDGAADRELVERTFSLPYSGTYAALSRWDYEGANSAAGTPAYYYVENYVPLYDAHGQVAAVVKIDKEPAKLDRTIDRGQLLVWGTLMATGVIIFLALFWLARHATHVMQDQQRRLVENEKLSVIGEMSLAVAHGIRNPLAAIRSSAEIAIDEVPEGTRKRLRDIVAQADRLSSWLRDLLQYSQPSAGHTQAVNVIDVLRESVDSYAARLGQAGITLDRSGMETKAAMVTADRPLLLQAFNGIISNAMEAMTTGGKLAVRCHVDTAKRIVSVQIADTGPGMSQERLAQAFQPFKTSKPRGLGIGLSLVKSTLERHGGRVSIDSRPDEGTRVELVLPLAR